VARLILPVNSNLEKLCSNALAEIKAAASGDDLKNLRIRYLGRKGALTALLRTMGDMSAEERPAFGKRANEVKSELEDAISRRETTLAAQGAGERAEKPLDVTLPGLRPRSGSIHPLMQVLNRMIEIFTSMGYEVAVGPEVEFDKYNFSLLNFPDNHPARDMQDTFFISRTGTAGSAPTDMLLRTHTSPVQIRAMEKRKPPMRVISPGKVYRHDRDASHSPMFFQLEGFIVDKTVSLADLKGTLTAFVREFFGKGARLRFRPSFFPFTEPSAEVDISCMICGGAGCRMCKQTGWLEILGSGMIHPQVLRNVGINPEEWTGFAFGMGVERISILKYGVEPIATFLENDLRFLKQF